MKSKTSKKMPYNVLVDPRMLKAAKETSADVPEAIRDLLEKIANANVCPSCGQLKKKK